MKTTITLLIALACAIPAVAGSRPTFLPVSQLRAASVTAYELGLEEADLPALESFHGRRIRCERRLGDREIRELIAVMELAESREEAEKVEAEAEGKVTGGVLACVTEEYGLRFTIVSGVYDSFVTIECRRIYPVARDGGVFVNMSEIETKSLRDLLVKSVRCP